MLTPYHDDEYMLRMARDLLDQQIIDVNGRKVVRVNDVTFEVRRENDHDILRVLEVDVGIRSIFRRLFQGVLPRTLDPPAAEPHSAELDPLGVLQYRRARSAAAAPSQHLARQARADPSRPIWRTSSKS